MESNLKRCLSYVIPCYCSAKTISSVVDEIDLTMRKMSSHFDYEIVLVNDGSPDNTDVIISNLARAKKYITSVNLARNFGQHAALMAGLKQTRGDIVVCLDDDGQTPADEVNKLIDKLDEGYDVVYASYPNKQHSTFRNLGSRLNGKMLVSMLNKPKDLYVSSYFVARRYVIDEMLRYENCYPYIMGLVLRTTKRICNVPVNHRDRKEGESGYSLGKLLNLWLNGFTSFSIKPLRMALYFGMVSAVLGFLFLVYIVINYFLNRGTPLGWSSTTAIILIMSGVILVVLGLIGEYVGRIFMCTNSTPQYVVREVIKGNDKDE